MNDPDPFKKLFASTQMNDAVAKFMAEENRRHESLAAALDMANPLRKAMDDMNLATIRATALAVPDSVTRMFEQTQKRWGDAAALDFLTKPPVLDPRIEEAMAFLHSNSILSEHAKLFERLDQGINKATLEAFERIGATMKGAFSDFDANLQARLAEATKPLAGQMPTLSEPALRMQSVLDGALKGAVWADQFRLPSIDLKTAALIGKAWGPEGLASQLRAVGLDRASMQALLLQAVEEGRKDGARRAEAEKAFEIGGISIWNWMTLLSLLITILVPIWQKIDADAAAANQTVAAAESEKRIVERMDALMRVVESMAEKTKPKTEAPLFVAKSRAAIVRRVGKSGATRIALVFPNQVVELVSEDGKWIEVEYFDWLAQEERSGWVLKKYFARIRGAER